MDKQTQEQDKLKKHESVKLTVKSISEKMAALDREVKYLVNKLQRWRPKNVEKPVREEQNETAEEEPTKEEQAAKGEGEEEVQVEDSESEDIKQTKTETEGESGHTEL